MNGDVRTTVLNWYLMALRSHINLLMKSVSYTLNRYNLEKNLIGLAFTWTNLDAIVKEEIIFRLS
mgnify:CR=1 FL=1